VVVGATLIYGALYDGGRGLRGICCRHLGAGFYYPDSRRNALCLSPGHGTDTGIYHGGTAAERAGHAGRITGVIHAVCLAAVVATVTNRPGGDGSAADGVCAAVSILLADADWSGCLSGLCRGVRRP